MGKTTGFLEFERQLPPKRPTDTRVGDYHEFEGRLPGAADPRPGRALHELRHPVLSHRLPAREPHPRLERPRLPGPVGGGARRAPRHEQLSRGHRPGLPGAVRGGLRPQHQRRPRHHQIDRARDRGPRARGGLDPARPGRRAVRQDGGGHRERAGRPRVRAAAGPGRSRRRGLRARRPHRGPASATGFRTSSSRRRSWTSGWPRWRRRASAS